jgi:uncharacterized protein YxeA
MINIIIIFAILIPATIALFLFYIEKSGTKGLVKQHYKTKDGKTHTARKERKDYII